MENEKEHKELNQLRAESRAALRAELLALLTQHGRASMILAVAEALNGLD